MLGPGPYQPCQGPHLETNQFAGRQVTQLRSLGRVTSAGCYGCIPHRTQPLPDLQKIEQLRGAVSSCHVITRHKQDRKLWSCMVAHCVSLRKQRRSVGCNKQGQRPWNHGQIISMYAHMFIYIYINIAIYYTYKSGGEIQQTAPPGGIPGPQ